MKQKFFSALDQARSSSTLSRWTTTALVLGAGGAASAQTGGTGAQAVTGLGLENMITAAADGIRTLISANAGPLMLALLPVMAFFFIWGRVRSLF